MKMKVVSQGAIVLAAGTSQRFGTDKRRLPLANGKTLLQQTIETVLPLFTEVLVVLRCDDQRFEEELLGQMQDQMREQIPEQIREQIPGQMREQIPEQIPGQKQPPRLRTYRAPESALGMGHSLANAIPQLVSDVAFICLADMPYIQPATLVRLQQAVIDHQHQAPIVRPVHAGVAGNPVGFNSAYFPDLVALRGDQGAKQVIVRHHARLVEVPVDDPGVLQDIDSPDDVV